ncbi:MAG: preprotein translocase subunit YajC [Actinomycetota bacterium]|nr:MAG: preprotein translocase subunit [Actinomycetota bacterium]MDO8949295.1 preprotein translocase subunit YajC [Actinomycetota bacterium]MDP3630725.1 preprotein translocase subunit YajC [Actinomycetota bacterium]
MNSQTGQLISFAVLIAAFYLLLVRPQMKRQKEQSALMASLAVGDAVVTIGGMFGTIRVLEEDRIQLEIAPNTTITMARSAIAKKIEA